MEVPAALGVPLKTPAEDSVNPAGSVPEVTDQLYGGVPPVAASVWLYALPTVPAGSGLTVVIDSAAGSTVTANAFVAVPPPVTWTVKLEVPAALGVPLKTPAEDSVSPAGSAPEVTDQPYGGVPPVAANVWLYALPTVPAGSGDDVVIDSAAGSTVTANAFVAVPPPLTWTVKLETPAAVGVPLKTPAEDSVSPAGSAPENTDQLYGVVPPVAANVWLYALPTVPAGSGDDVVIDSAAGSTVTENAFVAVPPPLTWTVKLEVPAARRRAA